ncbi:FecR domain-containing protein [Aliisedimentitalea scapharcae]|uniref:FecR domain-containing protein n=1 Tax=Aliisedimentitalea scapharcae TaxID=1524259 RepID=A0ABZ2XUM7_9RHOB
MRTGILKVMALTFLIVAIGTGGARGVRANQLNAPMPVIEFQAGDTLRELAAQYLQDPDLWPVVLTLNGILSPAQVVPGVQLRMPVEQVRAADVALTASLDAIQKANAEGAQIFAPVEIDSAINNREQAGLQRAVGEWEDVVALSDIATGFAQEALAISVAQRDRSAEAVVSDVQGSVEGRSPAEPTWSGRTLNDVLVEFERMRTLSNSTTQITFRDLSRLRLNANSNATIQRMRSDPLTGGEVTKVSLVNGDFYALLNQLSDNTSFEIDVPGVKTTTDSTDFWIKNDQKGARFVNYDGPDLAIQQGKNTIMVGANEGVVLSGGDAKRADVLGAVDLTRPAAEAIAYAGQVDLAWAVVQDAKGYWLEVARDPGFNQMQVSEWAIPEAGFKARDLAPGDYHWRVAAIDLLGLPGSWSHPRVFTMRIDETPPFLTVLSPATDSLVTSSQVEFLGVTEADAILNLNGERLEPGADGSFAATLTLEPGENQIRVDAQDPAGNRTTRAISVVYRPVEQVSITFSDQIPRSGQALATRTEQISVWGFSTAAPGADMVVIGSEAETVRSRIGPDGGFRFSVPVNEEPSTYRVEILSPTGAVEGRAAFSALQDRTPPDLDLDLPPPQATGEPELRLEGDAGDAVRLMLNDAPLAMQDGRFLIDAELEPGQNVFELVAEDAVGNLRVLRLETLLDVDPPQIINVDLGRPNGANGPIELKVEATDASGLRQAASYVLRIGDVEREGFLRCNAAQNICSASLPAEPGELELVELIIEDYAGNAAYE